MKKLLPLVLLLIAGCAWINSIGTGEGQTICYAYWQPDSVTFVPIFENLDGTPRDTMEVDMSEVRDIVCGGESMVRNGYINPWAMGTFYHWLNSVQDTTGR